MEAKGSYVIAEEFFEGDDKPFDVKDSEAQQRIRVLSIGEGVNSCKVGDLIIPYGREFMAFRNNDKTYIVLTDDQVVAVLDAK